MSSCLFHVLPVNVLCWQFRKLVIVNTTRHEETRCSRDPNSHIVSSGPVGVKDWSRGWDGSTTHLLREYNFYVSFIFCCIPSSKFSRGTCPGLPSCPAFLGRICVTPTTNIPPPADPGSDPARGLTIRRVTAQRRLYTFFVYRTG